ncbi:MAG: beta-glucosidase [Acidimicrobiia bacterium]
MSEPILSLEQKVALLAGADTWHTAAFPDARVPAIRTSDGPAGVRGTTYTGPASASFPCGAALGASFDTDLVRRVGEALGREARSKSAHVLLAPTVNLQRTPIGGRHFECMSEDPVLTARLAVAYVQGVQSQRVACCVKHFVMNDTEFERMTISSDVDERTLRELYLLPFEAVVKEADVRSVMSAYNRINGTYAADHVELLRGVLRDEWRFDGVVMSDWFGLHSTAEALLAGLDLEMPGPTIHRGEKLLAAVHADHVDESLIDESVARLLALAAWTGAGTDDGSERTAEDPETDEVLRTAAIAGMVLLKNEGGLLPLAGTPAIALVGPNAHPGQVQGGGSARVRPARVASPLDELRSSGLHVTHERGCSIDKRAPAMRGAFDVTYSDATGASATTRDEQLDLIWMSPPVEGVDAREFDARVRGGFVPDESGDWTLSLTSVGPSVLRIDGEVVVDNSVPERGDSFFGLGSAEVSTVMALEAGREYAVEVDAGKPRRSLIGGLTVGAARPVHADAIERAAAAAAVADVAVVVVGTNDDWETEGGDREAMALPGEQDELVRRVAAANPRTVVVVNAGSPVEMPWIDDVPAVMQVWFPGQRFGDALADVLLGRDEPGGRLPVTLPRRLEDTPAFLSHPGDHGHTPYAEGLFVGYRWYDARDIAPLFPFGHGLGYTTFAVTSASVSGSVDGGVDVTVSLANTGARRGGETVQCYVAPPAGRPRRPRRELRAFARVHADEGETVTAFMRLDRRSFATWDPNDNDWVVPEGTYGIWVGRSSRDLELAGEVTVAAAPGG